MVVLIVTNTPSIRRLILSGICAPMLCVSFLFFFCSDPFRRLRLFDRLSQGNQMDFFQSSLFRSFVLDFALNISERLLVGFFFMPLVALSPLALLYMSLSSSGYYLVWLMLSMKCYTAGFRRVDGPRRMYTAHHSDPPGHPSMLLAQCPCPLLLLRLLRP